MKTIYFCLTFLLVVTTSLAQDNNSKHILSYETFLQAIKVDTLIVQKSKRYKCSEDVFGELTYFYRKDTLCLIEHVYKQGFYEDYVVEHYYIEDSKLCLQEVKEHIAHQNTQSNTNAHSSSFSVQFVYELIERRTLIDYNPLQTTCYIRGEGKEMSKSKKLPFKQANCVTDLKTIEEHYRFLLKLKKKFLPIHHKDLACIFHVW